MDSPPMYAPPPKKKRTGLIIGLVVLAVFVCCGLPILAIGGFGVYAMNNAGGTIMCSISIEPIQRAVERYTEEKGHYPTAKNWEAEIRPYYEKEIKKFREGQNIFKTIPPEGPYGCAEKSGTTGFAINTAVAGKKPDQVKDKTVPMLFEVPKAGKNLAQAYKPVPADQSPKIFGKESGRGWFIIPVEGDPYILKNGKKARIQSQGSGFRVEADTKVSAGD